VVFDIVEEGNSHLEQLAAMRSCIPLQRDV
jgi:hypothetical protein